jgi:hypothetical protein
MMMAFRKFTLDALLRGAASAEVVSPGWIPTAGKAQADSKAEQPL